MVLVMKAYRNIFKTGAGLLSAIAVCMGVNIPVQAAETVVLRYGMLSDAISVRELEEIARTGKVKGHYRKYSDRLPIELSLK